VLADLLNGLVDGLERRARQLELTSGLKADGTAPRAILAPKRDDIALLGDGVPTEIPQSFEQRADAAVAIIGDWRKALPVETKLLVLGADEMMGLSGPLTRVDMWRAPFGLKDCPEQ
jgi:hypothetical protein